uniref:Uncharacterized protein n=1 Tax=Seriola dumerili TaxID=41447 RepID=A0A3B4U3P5_SERDU
MEQNQRALNRAMRELDRERMKLKNAKQGQMVRRRKRTYVLRGQNNL